MPRGMRRTPSQGPSSVEAGERFSNGPRTLVAALVVIYQTNLGSSHQRFRLRLAGIVIGGLYGLFVYVVVAHVPAFPIYALLFALGLLVCGYPASTFDRFN